LLLEGESAVNTQNMIRELESHVLRRLNLRFLKHRDRLATEEQWQKMIAHRRVPDVELALTMLPDMKEPMVCTDASRKLIKRAEALARALDIAIGHELTGNAGDAGYASKIGIPVLDGLGPIGGGDHSPREYLRLDSVASRSARLSGLTVSVASQFIRW
jgi:glutamate carboxypeptidase